MIEHSTEDGQNCYFDDILGDILLHHGCDQVVKEAFLNKTGKQKVERLAVEEIVDKPSPVDWHNLLVDELHSLQDFKAETEVMTELMKRA
jgi:hypothetical protein